MSDSTSPPPASDVSPPSPSDSAPSDSAQSDSAEPRAADAYWRANRRLIALLLAIWALVSYGFAILLPMEFSIGRLPAGFFWAQQGSMIVFVILIFVYAWRMDAIDRQHDVDEHEGPRNTTDEPGP